METEEDIKKELAELHIQMNICKSKGDEQARILLKRRSKILGAKIKVIADLSRFRLI